MVARPSEPGIPQALAVGVSMTLEVGTMAVYEFECQACHERFEVSAPMTEHDRLKEQPPACPKCGQRQSRQLTSLFSCKPPDKY